MKPGPLLTTMLELRTSGQRRLAVLIDPDKAAPSGLESLLEQANRATGVGYIFVGGSLLTRPVLEECLGLIRRLTDLPVLLFPGSAYQISHQADGILFLSLISGRNPEYLIGQHVTAAPLLRQSGLEIVPTAYMLVDGGKPTTVSYISHTSPIPADKSEIAVCTAMAGEMLGLQLAYLDAGSGALHPVPPEMIRAVSQAVELPILVGGGIRTPEQASHAGQAGAQIAVIGNVLEKDPILAGELAAAFLG